MRRPSWYDAAIWLAFTALGFLGPLAVGVLVGLATGANVTWEWIAGGGQFAVSSAGLLMTTAYFLARPGSISRLPLTELFMLISIVGLILGIVLFVLATLNRGGIEIDSAFYQVPSIVLFVAALCIAFVAVGLDRTRDIEDPGFLERGTRDDRRKIDEGFDATFGEEDR